MLKTIIRTETAGEKETGRLEAFSDGVFSIAMTLLVLELRPPVLAGVVTRAALWAALGRMWPSYFSFVTSFATILIMWANHHAIFRLIQRVDTRLLFTNGFLLLMVTAVPFPTALVATYLRTPAATTACAVYAGSFVLICFSYAFLLLAACRRDGYLLAPNTCDEVSRRLRDCFLVGLPLYALATIAALFSAWLSLGICTALWIFWAAASARTQPRFHP